MIEEFLDDASQRMDHAVEHVQGEFGTIRTGRANPGILSRVMVDYYGTPTPLQQLASFSVPDARLLVVSPYDKASIGNIEKAISASGLGLNPSSDGKAQGADSGRSEHGRGRAGSGSECPTAHQRQH